MTVTTESIVRLERSVWQAAMENDGAALAELFSDEYVEITLEGMTGWDWLHVEILWVDEKYRGEGIGSALLTAAETVARKRGCIGSCLTTSCFQAPAFYEQHGYSTFDRIDDYPLGKTMYFMSKKFPESTP